MNPLRREWFFPIEEAPVFATVTRNGEARNVTVPHKKALVAADTGHIVGIVGAGYKVFTNEQAVTLCLKFCLEAFPDTKPSEWTFVEGHGPGTRSWAAMDIHHRAHAMNLWRNEGGASETFTPFVRITNSYNGSRALRIDVGFLREHCSNGVIFEQEAATLTVPHTRQSIHSLKVARPFAGMSALREGDRFLTAFPCPENLRPNFESMTAELVDYRLAHYAKTRIEKAAELTAGRFVAKVSHSGGKPILRLPTVEELPGRPIGPTTVTLPDGSQWVFKFVKIACNVASPLGSEENQIPPLLRGWFGENAGAPGTNYQVAFTQSETGWSVEPVAVATPLRVVDASPHTGESEKRENRDLPGFVETPAAKEKFTRLVPVYSLEAAAGLWGPETAPEEIGWAEAAGASIKPGMFIARVRGHSMEPKIKDGSWNLFRPCPQGSREGRIVLVQFNSMGDPESGGRFTIKKYHSVKSVSEDGWEHERIELLPINPDYRPITVEPHEGEEMMVLREWISSIE